MAASITSSDPSAVKAEVSYFIKNYPVFYGPDQDWISAVSKRVGGSADSFLILGYQQDQPQFWYNQEVVISAGRARRAPGGFRVTKAVD